MRRVELRIYDKCLFSRYGPIAIIYRKKYTHVTYNYRRINIMEMEYRDDMRKLFVLRLLTCCTLILITLSILFYGIVSGAREKAGRGYHEKNAISTEYRYKSDCSTYDKNVDIIRKAKYNEHKN